MNIVPKHIEVKNSPGKGLGVFATKDFNKGELIERCYLISMDYTPKTKDYCFDYPLETRERYVLALGYGSIYNHNDDNNAKWKENIKGFFDFVAVKDIKKGDEICVNYGTVYWERQTKNKL